MDLRFLNFNIQVVFFHINKLNKFKKFHNVIQ